MMVTITRNHWSTDYLYLVSSGRTRKIIDCQHQAMTAELIEELIEDEHHSITLSPVLRNSTETCTRGLRSTAGSI